jgi:transcriptional regulator with PAS, ATPase and Fis domain
MRKYFLIWCYNDTNMVFMEHIAGSSSHMAELFSSIEKSSRSTWTVLIQGENGTGKGVVAREIHRRSKQARQPFVVVDCGAIPENLIESELFGHERGAFTGAERLKRGKFELAGTGTIFLDEIGELSPLSQTRLLHVLQDGEIERLGGEGQRIRVGARVIAATNRNLEKMVAEGSFRQDLYFRLNILSMRVPTLRERPEDIPALAHYFTTRSAAEAERSLSGVSPEVLNVFLKHPWPGNVRQLENTIRRAVAVGESERVLLKDLPDEFFATESSTTATRIQKLNEALDETTRRVCIAAFTASRGDCAQAGRIMGLHQSTVYRLVRKYGLKHQ